MVELLFDTELTGDKTRLLADACSTDKEYAQRGFVKQANNSKGKKVQRAVFVYARTATQKWLCAESAESVRVMLVSSRQRARLGH